MLAVCYILELFLVLPWWSPAVVLLCHLSIPLLGLFDINVHYLCCPCRCRCCCISSCCSGCSSSHGCQCLPSCCYARWAVVLSFYIMVLRLCWWVCVTSGMLRFASQTFVSGYSNHVGKFLIYKVILTWPRTKSLQKLDKNVAFLSFFCPGLLFALLGCFLKVTLQEKFFGLTEMCRNPRIIEFCRAQQFWYVSPSFATTHVPPPERAIRIPRNLARTFSTVCILCCQRYLNLFLHNLQDMKYRTPSVGNVSWYTMRVHYCGARLPHPSNPRR